jgi:uncharacterized DUF497 family protein
LRRLPVSGTIPDAQYEWDDAKAAENLRKHGEERIQAIGMARGGILFVIMTLRDEDLCRIISARKATRHEQDRYYAGDREIW